MNNYILEAFLLSDHTIAIDFHKFEQGGRLFIFGVSGSGKTSVGKMIEKKYRVAVCNLDSAWDIFEDKKLPPKGHPKRAEMFKAARKQMAEMVRDKRGCRVVEGIQFVFPPLNKFMPLYMKEACIIMGKSAVKGAWDASIRNAKNKGFIIFLRSLKGQYGTNRDMIRALDSFRSIRIKNSEQVSNTI